MSDLIDRQEAIKQFCKQDCGCDPKDCYDKTCYEVEIIESVPTHPTPSNTLGALDCVDRQAAIDAVKEYFKFSPLEGRQCAKAIERVPSAQPEIIRCKDCRYSIDEYGDGECYCKRPSRELVWIGKRWDFFCAAARLKMEVEHE